MVTEDTIQIQLAEILDRAKIDWYHVPNEQKMMAYLPKNIAINIIKKLRRMGLKPGVPDVCIVTPPPSGDYRGVYLELKSKNGEVRPNQKNWAAKLTKNGYYCETVYGLHAAVVALRRLGYKI